MKLLLVIAITAGIFSIVPAHASKTDVVRCRCYARDQLKRRYRAYGSYEPYVRDRALRACNPTRDPEIFCVVYRCDTIHEAYYH